MRIRQLVFICLVMLSVFSLPTDILANNGKAPDKADPQADVEKESSNPVVEDISEQRDQTSEATKKSAKNKDDDASKVVEESINQGEQNSQEASGKENQVDKGSKNKKSSSKNKDETTLPAQASDQASEVTEKVEKVAATKKDAVEKKVEDKQHGKNRNLEGSVEKSSESNKKQNPQTNSQNDKTKNINADEEADEEEDLLPTKFEEKSTSGKDDQKTSVSDSGENIDFKNEQIEKPLSNSEPIKDPYTHRQKVMHASFPSPISTSGGDTGPQTGFSFMVKGNLPGLVMFFDSESQIIRSKAEFLRDQWVNAPPTEPPKVAS